MTAKQRAARAKFKAVVAEAKKLRKKNPKLTQAQAVKQAFAISYSKAGKKKVGAVKKSKFEVGDMVYSYQNKEYKAPISYKKFVPWESLSKPSTKDKFVYKLKIKDGYSNWINEESLSNSSLGAVKKKSATRVKAKKNKGTEMHTDTKSHNVNIRVVSGIDQYKQMQFVLDDIKFLSRRIAEYQKTIDSVTKIPVRLRDKFERKALSDAKIRIKNLKVALNNTKKNIKF